MLCALRYTFGILPPTLQGILTHMILVSFLWLLWLSLLFSYLFFSLLINSKLFISNNSMIFCSLSYIPTFCFILKIIPWAFFYISFCFVAHLEPINTRHLFIWIGNNAFIHCCYFSLWKIFSVCLISLSLYSFGSSILCQLLHVGLCRSSFKNI